MVRHEQSSHHYTAQREERYGRWERSERWALIPRGEQVAIIQKQWQPPKPFCQFITYGFAIHVCQPRVVGDGYCLWNWLADRFSLRTGCQNHGVFICSTFERVRNEGFPSERRCVPPGFILFGKASFLLANPRKALSAPLRVLTASSLSELCGCLSARAPVAVWDTYMHSAKTSENKLDANIASYQHFSDTIEMR